MSFPQSIKYKYVVYLIRIFTLRLSRYLAISLSLYLSFFLSLNLSPSPPLIPSLYFSLSHTHRHTHSHTQTPTHTLTHTRTHNRIATLAGTLFELLMYSPTHNTPESVNRPGNQSDDSPTPQNLLTGLETSLMIVQQPIIC